MSPILPRTAPGAPRWPRRWARRAALLLAAGLLPACGPPAEEGLLVSAASDLRFAFVEVGEAFERETGVAVTFNFGSTGHLALQIERGAPADVFAAADHDYVDELVISGHILADTRAIYGRGFLVLWALDGDLLPTGTLRDLLDTRVRRIAVANPDHAPYGVAAREALHEFGIWEAVQPKLVLAENVNQALQYARSGNVDVAIAALSLALAPGVGEGVHRRVPPELHAPLDQVLGVVATTRHEAKARAFASFVDSPSGRRIMDRYGFVLPPGSDGGSPGSVR